MRYGRRHLGERLLCATPSRYAPPQPQPPHPTPQLPRPSLHTLYGEGRHFAGRVETRNKRIGAETLHSIKEFVGKKKKKAELGAAPPRPYPTERTRRTRIIPPTRSARMRPPRWRRATPNSRPRRYPDVALRAASDGGAQNGAALRPSSSSSPSSPSSSSSSRPAPAQRWRRSPQRSKMAAAAAPRLTPPSLPAPPAPLHSPPAASAPPALRRSLSAAVAAAAGLQGPVSRRGYGRLGAAMLDASPPPATKMAHGGTRMLAPNGPLPHRACAAPPPRSAQALVSAPVARRMRVASPFRCAHALRPLPPARRFPPKIALRMRSVLPSRLFTPTPKFRVFPLIPPFPSPFQPHFSSWFSSGTLFKRRSGRSPRGPQRLPSAPPPPFWAPLCGAPARPRAGTAR